MTFSVKGADINFAIKQTVNAISKLETKPILNHLFCTVDKEKETLTVFGTDLELNIATTISITNPTENQTFLILPTKIERAAAHLGNQLFTFEVSNNTCRITVKDTSFQGQFLLPDSNQYPTMPVFNMDGAIRVKRSDFFNAQEFVSPAQCDEPSRLDLLGLDVNGERVIATNGKLCMAYRIKTGLPQMLLSDRAANMLKKLLQTLSAEEIRVQKFNDYQVFDIEETRFWSKMRPGNTMARAEGIIQNCLKSNHFSLTLESKSLSDVLALVEIGISEDDPRALFTITSKEVTIHTASNGLSERSEAKASIPSLNWTGPESYQITLNLEWLSSIMDSIVEQEKVSHYLTFKFAESNVRPVIIEEGPKVCLIQPAKTCPATVTLKGTADHRRAKVIEEKVAR